MKLQEFRTAKRRMVTRESGFSVQGDYTGGESIIVSPEKTSLDAQDQLIFKRTNLDVPELFQANLGFIAFSAYLKLSKSADISVQLTGKTSKGVKFFSKKTYSVKENSWTPIGVHEEISGSDDFIDQNLFTNDSNDDKNIIIENISEVTSTITVEKIQSSVTIDLISVDLDTIDFFHFKNKDSFKYFKQKTSIYIPGIYYLKTDKSVTDYLYSDQKFTRDCEEPIVLKSCNRCSRLLPIDASDINNILEFSNHCVKRAPCIHSNFNNYSILNIEDLANTNLDFPFVVNEKVFVEYGHQLECRSCKKFFVNAPLNPQRTTQQHREDSLRRRSFEQLVNHLYQTNTIHQEFAKSNEIDFSEYIWEKFDRKCFKCKKEITLNEMHLDHTMPLAYLYPLDLTATALCATHNLEKSAKFPIHYYTKKEIEELILITGIDPEIIKSDSINKEVVTILINETTWFFDVFLMQPHLYKVRDGKLTSKIIYENLNKIMTQSGYEDNLLEKIYIKNNNRRPFSLSKKEKKL